MVAQGMYVVIRQGKYPARFRLEATAEFREFQKIHKSHPAIREQQLLTLAKVDMSPSQRGRPSQKRSATLAHSDNQLRHRTWGVTFCTAIRLLDCRLSVTHAPP